MGQPLRFGVIRNQAMPWNELISQWLRIEDAGFDSGWGVDHFQRPSDPHGPHFDSWTTLAAVAAQTSRLRLGILVTSNTFRHPALLAKQAVSLDHVSHGRLEIGLGTGWFALEHESFGIDFPPPAERVERLREAVEIIDRLMRQDISTYEGRYYRLRDAPFRPPPVQRPRPPITLGAHGPKMLRITAKYADRWNSYGTVDDMRERGQALDVACADIGRDPTEIIRSLYCWPKVIGADPWESPTAFLDVVRRYREAGITEFIFELPQDNQWSTMERITAEVIPTLRAESGTR